MIPDRVRSVASFVVQAALPRVAAVLAMLAHLAGCTLDSADGEVDESQQPPPTVFVPVEVDVGPGEATFRWPTRAHHLSVVRCVGACDTPCDARFAGGSFVQDDVHTWVRGEWHFELPLAPATIASVIRYGEVDGEPDPEAAGLVPGATYRVAITRFAPHPEADTLAFAEVGGCAIFTAT